MARKNGATYSVAAQYMREVRAVKTLTREEEVAIGRRARAGDRRAEHALVEAHLRFAVRIAKDHGRYGLPLSDLIQEANIGLLRAAKDFDPERGFRFMTYAVWWVRLYVRRYIMNAWSLVRIGTTQAQKRLFWSMLAVQNRLRTMGARADAPAVAAACGVRVEDVAGLLPRMRRDASLDVPCQGDEEETRTMLVDQLLASEPTPEEQVIGACERAALHGAVHRLSARQRAVVYRRLATDEEETLRAIGKDYGVTRQAVGQLEQRTLTRLAKMVAR